MFDLIDREALKKKYCDCCAVSPDCMGSGCKIYEARCLIAELPTVEAAPVRHGRWKKKNGEIYCTNCKKSKWSESFELMLRGFDFCPNCGAEMRKEGTDNG